MKQEIKWRNKDIAAMEGQTKIEKYHTSNKSL